jgi:RNA ligase (TIGR02306 family)
MDVLKYESVAEKVSGNGNTARISTFPSFIPKTDQERVQNINLKRLPEGETYEVTMKLDGSSMTVWCKDGEIGVASRNQTVYDGTSEAQGHFALTAIKSGALQALIDYYDTTGQSLAIQGEVMGPGIQQNQEELQEHEFFVFDIFNIDTQNYLLPAFRQVFVEEFGLKHVPVLAEARQILAGATHDMILSDAEGPSLNPKKQREGVVYKANGRDRYGHIPHFKAISNKWLLKNE